MSFRAAKTAECCCLWDVAGDRFCANPPCQLQMFSNERVCEECGWECPARAGGNRGVHPTEVIA